MQQPPSVLMVGTGEYTTGLVHVSGSKSDKKIGVVAVTLFDLRSPHRGSRVGKLKMVGTNGTKFPAIREHLKKNIQDVYKDISVDFESFPSDTTERDPDAYITALDSLNPGDLVIIFTPDDTHYQIAKEALSRKMHVLVTKPAVKTLKEHHDLIKLSKENNLVSAIEVHKRWDPIYADARYKIRSFGDFSYMCAYMSQPKYQLDTFKYWAGKSSDISYYLNSHHVDFLCWSLQGIAKPITVFAMKSTGVATSPPYELTPGTEDSITLTVQFLNLASGNLGTAVFTSAWIAPKSDCHSQQRFFYMGHKGEITVDQAHRGYSIATDDNGLQAVNPLFMKYSPDEYGMKDDYLITSSGRFAAQRAYGYLSIEAFVDAATQVRNGKATAADYDKSLATLATTSAVTAVLEAGRLSLDSGGVPVKILYEDQTNPQLATSITK